MGAEHGWAAGDTRGSGQGSGRLSPEAGPGDLEAEEACRVGGRGCELG